MSDLLTYSPIPIFINYIALPIGLLALFLRGRAILNFSPGVVTRGNVKSIMGSNMVWNLALFFWIITNGIIWGRRLVAPSMDYFESPWVLSKIILLFLIFLADLKPMLFFLRWRLTWLANKNPPPQLEKSQLQTMVRFNYLVMGLTILIVLIEISKMISKHL